MGTNLLAPAGFAFFFFFFFLITFSRAVLFSMQKGGDTVTRRFLFEILGNHSALQQDTLQMKISHLE